MAASRATGDQESRATTTATELWRQVIERFRGNMPSGRRRVRMRHYDDCFSGYEAVEWLLHDLQASGLFGTVVREQAVTLLNKFVISDVIESVRESKERGFEDGPRLYRFVRTPGPFNFLEDEEGVADCIANTHASFTSTTDDTPPPAAAAARPCLAEVHTNTLVTPTATPTKILTTPHEQLVAPAAAAAAAAVWREVTLSRLRAMGALPPHELQQLVLYSAGGRGSTVTAEHDLPNWVIMAFRCLSKWPNGSAAGGSPYPGFAGDIMEALAAYFTAQSHPLVDSNLYQLYMSILGLIRSNESSKAISILQLASLLLTQRVKLHRMLRFINKTSANTSLTLSSSQSNRDKLLEAFNAAAILRRPPPAAADHEEPSTAADRNDVVWFMVQHYHSIFTVSSDIKTEVDTRLQHTSRMASPPIYCQRVTTQQYSAQATSHSEIAQLLETIATDENMSSKTRKRRLKQFKKVYPEVYAAKYPRDSKKQ